MSSTTETDSERQRRKKEKAKRQREKMLSYVLEHLEKGQSDSSSSQPPSRIKPPPNLRDRATTIIPTRRFKSPKTMPYETARSLTPPPSSSRASSSHSEHRFPSHTKAWLEDRAANQQQLQARHPLRGRGSRPRGCQNQQPTRSPVFYQDPQPTKTRGVSKKPRGYRGQRRRLTDAELTHYHKQNKAILSVHHQRRHTGAVPKLDRFSYIPHQNSESPTHQPHSGEDNQMDIDLATPPRRHRDDRA